MDCILCDGRGQFSSGFVCGRCGGTGNEPPTGKETAEMFRYAKSILGDATDDCTDIFSAKIIYVESSDCCVVQTDCGKKVSAFTHGKQLKIGQHGAVLIPNDNKNIVFMPDQ